MTLQHPLVSTGLSVLISCSSFACDAAPDAAAPTAEAPASPQPSSQPEPAPTAPADQPEPGPDCHDLGPTPQDSASAFIAPNGDQVQGFDVSQAQGEVPWRTLSQSAAQFVYIRASQGVDITDRDFTRNWSMSRACELPRGAYHVFDPTQDSKRQAEHFLSLLGQDYGELPPVVDVEFHKSWAKGDFPDPESYLAALIEFLDLVEAKTAHTPMIYIQPWYWNAYLGSSAELTRFSLWAAGTAPPARRGWPWTFWQRGPHVHWDGRTWDHDVFHASREALDAFIESKGAKPAPLAN